MFSLDPTPFDVRLVAFGIPIRVHPSFWVGMIVLGWVPDRMNLTFIWVVCGFFSILIHELGHAVTAEWFGWPTEILMYFGGGLATSHRHHNDTPLRSIVVSIMGPVAGFLLLAQVLLVEMVLSSHGWLRNPYYFVVFGDLFFMNLFWGLLNLLPVLPLDGGNILHSFCQLVRLRDPFKVTLWIGAIVSGLATYFFFVKTNQQFAGFLMMSFCVQNVSMLQSRR